MKNNFIKLKLVIISIFLLIPIQGFQGTCVSHHSKYNADLFRYSLSQSYSSSSYDHTIKSNLTEEEVQKYYEMIELKSAFCESISFLPQSFNPSSDDYWTNLNKIITVFAVISAFPLAFILFYLFMRLVFKKCDGPVKKRLTKAYRNVTMILVIGPFIAIFVLFICIMSYSGSANDALINSINKANDYGKEAEKSYKSIENIEKEIEATGINFNKTLLQALNEGINKYVTNSNERTEDFKSKENNRHIGTVLIAVGFIILSALILVCFIFKYHILIFILSVIVLLYLPAMVVFEGYTAKFYFNYSDWCSNVYSSIHQNAFPVPNTGLGYYVSCLEKDSLAKIYSVNYELFNFTKTASKDYEDLKNKTLVVINENIQPLIQCENVKTVVPKIEKEFCVDGMTKFKNILTLQSWTLLLILIYGVGVTRLDFLVRKKKAEIESILESTEALY